MQWDGGTNAGFSTGPPEQLVRPVISGGPYGRENINVKDQERDPDSLLNRTAHMIRTRSRCPEFGFGRWQIIHTDSPGGVRDMNGP